MGKQWRYITVEEDEYYRKRANELGIYYSTPHNMFLRDAPPETDAFEYSPNHDEWIEEFFI